MIVGKPFFKRCIYLCWISLAVTVILFAFIVSITRMMIPLLADYRQDFESVASRELGRPVTIGNIDAEWIGLWPKIHLSNVNIQGTDARPFLQATGVWLSVDLLSLLTKGHLDAERVRISGLKLNVQRKKEAVYLINNESFRLDKSSSGDQSALVEWLFSRDLLQLSNSDMTYSDDRYDVQKIGFSEVNLNLENDRDNHHVFGRFKVLGERISELSFVMDLQGDMLKPQEVVNDFYVKGDVFVSRIIKQWARPFAKIKEGEIFLELWGHGHLYQLEQIKAQVNANELKWILATEGAPEESNDMQNIQARVFWLRAEKGWSLDVENLTLKYAGSQWPTSDMHLVYQQSESGVATLEGTVGFLRLQDVGNLISNNIPDSFKMKQYLRKLNAHGDLSDIRFSFTGSSERLDQYYFNSKISKLGFEKWESVPGLSNLAGEVLLNNENGLLKLDSKKTMLDFGTLFPKPLKLNELKGDIHWKKQDGDITVSFDGLKVNNDHLQSSVRANIKIPANGPSPFLDIQADFSNGIAKYVPLYVPRILSKGSHEWLDAAFVGGFIPSGRMIYHGSTAEYPFTNNKGTFIVDFNAKDVLLNYGQSWPDLEKMDARILFKDDAMEILVEKAEIMKIKTLASKVRLDHLNSNTVLTADMKFAGNLQQLLAYMHDSPIGADSRDFIEKMSVNGSMLTSVKLKMPLLDIKNFHLKGVTEFKGNTIALKEWKQTFKNVTGELYYEHDKGKFKYASNKLTAKFHGKPANVKVKTIRTKSLKLATTATLNANVPSASLMSPVMDVDHVLKGESEWKIELSLYENKKSTLRATSNLKGTVITLPDSFSKRAARKQSVQLQLNMLDGDVGTIDFNMGKKFKSVFKLSSGVEKEIYSGEILLGEGRVKLPKNKGVNIKGRLDTLSLDKWLNLFPDNKKRMTDASALKKINAVKVSIAKIKTGRQDFNQIKIDAKGGQDSFLIDVNAREIDGAVKIPYVISPDKPIELDLKYLSWLKADKTPEEKVQDPRLLPSADLSIDKFVLNKKVLGAVFIKAREHQEGISFDELSVQGKVLNVSGAGSWLFRKSWHESNVSLKINAPVIDQAMAIFDFKSSIKGGAVDAQLQANWTGPPHWFEMKRLDGTVHLQIKNGNLSELDPGGGRIFGLLNIQTVRRRLSLDFNDLFKKGFGFDKIRGNFSISDGDAYTNDLYLEGPAARIDIQGRIGLAAEDYDEVVLVSPKLSSSIPLLGLAAGPQVAIGLLLTEKLFRKRLNKLSVTRYNVTGPWDKPVVTKIVTKEKTTNEVEIE